MIKITYTFIRSVSFSLYKYNISQSHKPITHPLVHFAMFSFFFSTHQNNVLLGWMDLIRKWIQKLDAGLQFDNRTRYGALFLVKMKMTEEGSKNQTEVRQNKIKFEFLAQFFIVYFI